MKNILLLVLIFIPLCPRQIKRIIRTNYNMLLKYNVDQVLAFADSEFAKFEDEITFFVNSNQSCIKKFIIRGQKEAQKKCFGKNFDVYDDSMNFLIYKLHNTYVNLIALAFNELCMNDENIRAQCIVLQDDFEMLEFYSYDLKATADSNYAKYTTEHFKRKMYFDFINNLNYIIQKWENWKSELENRKDILKG